MSQPRVGNRVFASFMALADFGDFEACALGSSLHRGGELVTFDFFGGCVPTDFASESTGDGRQVAKVHGLEVGVNIRDWQSTFADASVEVGFVPFVGFAFVEGLELLIAVDVFVPLLFDGLAGDPLAVDEDTTFGAFDEQSVIASARDMDFHSVGECMDDIEIVRGIETVVGECLAVFHLDGVFAIGAIDFDRSGSLFGHFGCP